MSFTRHQQSSGAFVGEVRTNLQLDNGGSSATTPEAAVASIGGLHVSIIGAPNGVLGLDATGKVPKENDPRIFDTIDGPKTLVPGVAGTYEITNYDSRRSYIVSSLHGVVVRTNSTITFTPSLGLSGDVATFLVNNRLISVGINASAAQIQKPTIISPANNSTIYSRFVTLSATAFRVLNNALNLKASDWRIGSDQLFSGSSLLYQQTVTSENMSLLFIGPDVTSLSTDLYVSVRYRADNQETGDEVISAWSDAIKFSTNADVAIGKEIGTLASHTPTTDGFFGSSVSTASNSSDSSVLVAVSDKQNNCVDIYKLSNASNTLSLEKRIVAPSPDTSFKFGTSVTLSPDGEFLAVSAPGYKTATPIKGAVYLYARGVAKDWQQSAILEGDNSCGFVSAQNKSIAVSDMGNRVIASEPAYDSNQGKVLVFVKNVTTWSPFSLTVPTAYAAYGSAYFGKDAVAISANSAKIAVTCRTAADTFTVLIFKANGGGWDFEGSLGSFRFTGVPSVSQCSLEFNLSDSKIVVGIPTAVSVNNETGGRASVWSFASASGWTKETELYEHGLNIKSEDGAYFGSLYGYSVAFSSSGNNVVFVGSPGYDSDDVNRNVGRVFVYKYLNAKWTYAGFCGPTDQADEDKFGLSLASVKTGECLVVGVPGSQADVGSVSIYR